MKTPRANPHPAPEPLWVCVDSDALPAAELVPRLADLAAALPLRIWLRPAPAATARALRDLATRVLERACDGASCTLIIGDRVDVALAAGAHGVHLTTRSVTPDEARRVLARIAPDRVGYVSAAVHDAHAVSAAAPGVDALVLSPLFATPGKGPALGVGRFAVLRASAPAKTFVALGGIVAAEHAARAAVAGADTIAVRRAWREGSDPVGTCIALDAAFRAAREALDPAPAR